MDIVFADEEIIIYRFQSQCLEPGCAIDVVIDKKVAPEHPFVELDFWDRAEGLWLRLRWCWKMLTQGLGFRHEFFIREEDLNDFIQVLRRAKFPFKSKGQRR